MFIVVVVDVHIKYIGFVSPRPKIVVKIGLKMFNGIEKKKMYENSEIDKFDCNNNNQLPTAQHTYTHKTKLTQI